MNTSAWTTFVQEHRQEIARAATDASAMSALYRRARIRGVFKREADLPLEAFKAKLASEPSLFSPVDCKAPPTNALVDAPAWFASPVAMDKALKRVQHHDASPYTPVADRLDDMLSKAWNKDDDVLARVAEAGFAHVDVSIKDRVKNVINAARGKQTSLDRQEEDEEDRGRSSSSKGDAKKRGSNSRSRSRSRGKKRGSSRSRSRGKKSRSRSRSKSPRSKSNGTKSVKFAAIESHAPSMYKRASTIINGSEGAKYRALGDIVVCQHLTELSDNPASSLRTVMATQSIFEVPVNAPAPDPSGSVKVRLHVMDAPRDIKSQHVREIKPKVVARLDNLPELKRSSGVSSITLYDISPAVPMSSFHYDVDGGKVPLPIFAHLTVPHPGESKDIHTGMILSRVQRKSHRYGCLAYQCPSSGAALHIILHFDRELEALTRIVLVQTDPVPGFKSVASSAPLLVDLGSDTSTQALFSDFLSVQCPVEGRYAPVKALEYLNDQELESMANVEGLLDRFRVTPPTNDRAIVLKASGWKESVSRGEAGPTLGALRDLVIDAIEKSTGSEWNSIMSQLEGETLDVEISAQSRTSGLARGVLDRLRRVPPLRRSLPVYRSGQLCALVLTADLLRALRLSSVRDLVDDKSSSGVVRPVSAKLFIKTSVPRRNVPSGLKFQVAAESVEELRRGTLETPAVLVGTFLRSAYGNSKANPNVDEGVILTMVASNSEGDFDKAVLYFVRSPQV